ncbi:uncharacterized protein [Miscanthus floridulus]|uniref:uncharacterized protein n=1 Tax=Miscanthus floridulus TaxID=154761 RepID=UPI00345A1EBE
MRQLGFEEREIIQPEAQDIYSKLFGPLLSDSHVCALAAIFGWEVGTVWNVRGLNNRDRRNSVRDVVISSNADIICLQETKAADKNNANLDRAMMGRFRRFLDDNDLKEIPLLGRKYTWSNERRSPTLVRLDRAFCCGDWENIFPDAVLQSTAAGVSDHCPLILGLKVCTSSKRRFHFESFWTKLPGFLDAVKQNWEAAVQSTCAVECIFLKLQRLSKGLQKWGQRKVGNIKAQLELAKEILHRLEIERDSRALSDREEWLRKKLKLHCLSLASLEQTIARLRSRFLYLREGDANTAFFHQQARYRKKKNFISKLQVGNQVVVTQDEKQKAVDDFYESILGTAEERDYTLDLDILNIQHHNLSELDASFSEEEVWATIKDMPLDKAPGPDGFTGRFYKSY